MNAALKVAVARKDCRSDEVTACDSLRDFHWKGTGVADTSGTAIGDDVEAELRERVNQIRLFEVFGHNA